MAKTVFRNNHADIAYGHEVETTVASATAAGGAVKVYPAAIQSIAFSMLLRVEGIGDVTVTSVGSDGGGDYFTFAGETAPTAGAAIRTPWLAIGPLLYTRAENSITLAYTASAEHDLYFATQRTPDSGWITVRLDGAEVAGSPFDLAGSLALVAVLLKEKVARGEHTVEITAGFPDPSNDVFVYFDKIELLEHVRQTGGFYYFLGPAPASLETSTINFVGDWNGTSLPGYAFTNTAGASAFFYPQLGEDGEIKIRVQKTPDSGIVAVYKDGAHQFDLDLYADPAAAPVDVTLFSEPETAAAEQMEIELRLKDTKNALSSGFFFYLRGTVVVFARTDAQALQLAADYLERVAALRGDGAFLDAYDSTRINFDANSLYGCMGLLAAYQALGDPDYLTRVKEFLTWFAGMQMA
ncbi:MAG TPA: hypothetical protein VNN17_12240, partial [Terriglobia bacterium]|nr:hypothetical protein [Terriglobia bacterium]